MKETTKQFWKFMWSLVELALSLGSFAFNAVLLYWVLTHGHKLKQIWNWMWN